MSWLGFERAQLPEIAEKLTNASGDVEERRFQRRVNALKSVRASAPVVAFFIHDEFFSSLLEAVPSNCARDPRQLLVRFRVPPDQRVIHEEAKSYRQRDRAKSGRDHRVRLLAPDQDKGHDIADRPGYQQNSRPPR